MIAPMIAAMLAGCGRPCAEDTASFLLWRSNRHNVIESVSDGVAC